MAYSLITSGDLTEYANQMSGLPSNVSDGNLATYCQQMTYLAFELSSSKVVSKIQIAVHNSTANSAIVDAVFQGSNDTTNGSNGTWDTLVTVTALNQGTPSSFPGWGDEITFTNTTSYGWYRLSNLLNSTSNVINEVRLYEETTEGEGIAFSVPLQSVVITASNSPGISFSVPMQLVSIVASNSSTNDFDISLPQLTASIVSSFSPRISEFDLSIPMMTQEWGASSNKIDISQVLPVFDVLMHRGGTIAFDLPEMLGAVLGQSARVASGEIGFPSLEMRADAGARMRLELPNIIPSIQADAGVFCTGNLYLPELLMTATADYYQLTGDMDVDFPKLLMNGGVLPVVVGSMTLNIPILRGEITAIPEMAADMAFYLESMIVEMAGNGSISGDIDIDLPLILSRMRTDNADYGVLRHIRNKVR